MSKPKIYFVSSNSGESNEVMKRYKPKNVMKSYFYFKNVNLKKWCKKTGYKPNILLDSGAFSAWTQDKEININKYIKYIKENINYINNYIVLDKINEPKKTYENYIYMRNKGLNPLPVFHYGSNDKFLKKYINNNEKYILLGGVAKMKNKKLIRNWANRLIFKYPKIKFHLLGITNTDVINNTKVYSCDSSAYLIAAIFGKPKHIKGNDFESRVKRAIYNIDKIKKEIVDKNKYNVQLKMF